eukprot:TRINITY_DN3052_c0_g1_i6.p1 TRINITY_DN3052_c0_g1~~TRINITY_DN3052_c0_g1_i6.p1  ORF type:complete len:113 (-),score=9.26 TRINITY_DN3052_c0_g1_i6:297-635(-)
MKIRRAIYLFGWDANFGSDWHPKIHTKQNHLIHNDAPWFIMESYEECHDHPPRLFVLDKQGTIEFLIIFLDDVEILKRFLFYFAGLTIMVPALVLKDIWIHPFLRWHVRGQN